MGDDDPFGSYGLKPVGLEDKPVFDQCLSYCYSRLSDYTFANVFMWRNPIHLRWALIHGCVCVFANGDGGLTLLLPPVGAGDAQAALRESLTICDDYNCDARLDQWTRVEYVSRDFLDRLPPGGFVVEPMSGDYVYQTASMIDLAGGELASKRQARNRFQRRYQARVEDYTPARHREACMQMLHRWSCQADDAEIATPAVSLKRSKDVQAAGEALSFAPRLGLRGMVLYAGDQMVGFTLGEQLDERSCSVLVEKTDRQYAGSAQYIFSEFCRLYWAHTTWTNAGDDWEVPSLQWTKQSYRPCCRLEKFVLRPVRSAMIPAPMAVQGGDLVKATAAEQPTSFVLNRAAIGDLDDLLALENRSFSRPLALSRRQLRYLLKSPSASVHVLRCEGVVVGDALLLRRRRRSGPPTARLYSIAVDAGFRGRGFGKALLSNCIEVLAGEGVQKLVLEVDVDNHSAVGLYESFGFRRARRLSGYYGPGRDGWKMHLKVPAQAASAGQQPQAASCQLVGS